MSTLRPLDLRCEHLATAYGLNTPVPRFGWALEGDGAGQTQSAYRLRVMDADSRVLLWDSGKIFSAETQLIPYAGEPLASDRVLDWTVEVWDENDSSGGTSRPSRIFTGLGASDWQAQWIARYFVLPAGREVPADNAYDNRWQARPADHLRRSFASPGAPTRATLYVTALGLYEAYLNGQRVGDHVMAPRWTDYHRRVEYQVHDVTEHVSAGENVL